MIRGASKAPNEYDLVFFRPLKIFSIQASLLPLKGLIIDIGCGQGIADLEMAQKYHQPVVGINAQDFLTPLLYGDFKALPIFSGHFGYKDQERFFSYLYSALGLPFHGLDDAELHFEQARERIQQLLKSGIFQYKVGYAEEILKNYPRQALHIFDYIAAFTYSPERAKLLELIYGSLAEGGQADITTQSVVQRRARVKISFLKSQSLLAFASQKYPTIFSLKEASFSMRRDPNIEKIDLGLELLPNSVRFKSSFKKAEAQMPVGHYRVKTPEKVPGT